MLLLLLAFLFLLGGSLLILAFRERDAQGLFFVTGSFFYLFCAHLFYFGSYLANPSLYQTRLKFLPPLLQSRIALIVCGVLYVVSCGYQLHYFQII
jgi:hypothetical protein